MAQGSTGAVAGVAEEVAATRRPGAVDKAYTTLVRRIDLREVLPGERLPAATELATEIGVSRMAVLQALQLMQSEGRVTVRPGRGGARVAPRADSRELRFALQWAVRSGLKDLHPFYEVIVQGVGGHLARHGMTEDDLAAAHALLDEAGRATSDDERLSIENRFFKLIGRATGTRLLEMMVLLARQHVSALYDLLDVPSDRPEQWLALERGLLRAIESGDTGAASDVMSGLFGDAFGMARDKFELDDIGDDERSIPANGPSNGQARAMASRRKGEK